MHNGPKSDPMAPGLSQRGQTAGLAGPIKGNRAANVSLPDLTSLSPAPIPWSALTALAPGRPSQQSAAPHRTVDSAEAPMVHAGCKWLLHGQQAACRPGRSVCTAICKLYMPCWLTRPPSSESSPNRRARSHRLCVTDSSGMGSLYVKRCCCGRRKARTSEQGRACMRGPRASDIAPGFQPLRDPPAFLRPQPGHSWHTQGGRQSP